MTTEKFTIAGMSCGHCAMAVQKELSKLEGVTAEVVIGTATVTFNEEQVPEAAIVAAITEAGYAVTATEHA